MAALVPVDRGKPPSVRTTAPSPGGRDSTGGEGRSRSPTKWRATSACVLRNDGASRTVERSRRGSYSSLHADPSPVISEVSKPAIIPPLSPQPPKPVAT